jgi:hypothetical protein
MKFKSKYLSEFKVKFEMASGYETQAQMGSSDEKKPQVKNLFRKSLLSEYRNICTELYKHPAFKKKLQVKNLFRKSLLSEYRNICIELYKHPAFTFHIYSSKMHEMIHISLSVFKVLCGSATLKVTSH